MADDRNIRVDDREVMRLLRELSRRAKNMKPALKEVGEIMLLSVQENFDKEGRPDKWEDLSEFTKRQRRRKGRWPGKILQQTGRLLQSINYRATADRVSLGTSVQYAPLMHFGGRAGDYRSTAENNRGSLGPVVPARPFMLLQTPEDIDDIKETLREYIMEAERDR